MNITQGKDMQRIMFSGMPLGESSVSAWRKYSAKQHGEWGKIGQEHSRAKDGG